MGMRSAQGWNPYDSSGRKTFKSALCHLLHTEFPGVFGPTISGLFAEKIDELFERFHPPRSRFKAGQVFWTGVAVDDPPSRDKRIEHTRLVPVVLNLVTPDDIETAKAKERRSVTRGTKIVRLFRQAHEQGAVLGHADVSLLLNMSISRLSAYVIGHECDGPIDSSAGHHSRHGPLGHTQGDHLLQEPGGKETNQPSCLRDVPQRGGR